MDKQFMAVEIIVVANGYRLRESFPHELNEVRAIPVGSRDYVFENLDSLMEFLQERLFVPLEKRENE